MKTLKKPDFVFFLSLILVIFVSFIFFTPRVASTLFPFKRHMVWNTFIQNVKSQNRLDPQKFWGFREFYSPGYFRVSKTGFDIATSSPFENKIAAPTKSKYLVSPFALFTSRLLTSVDSLATQSALTAYIDTSKIPESEKIFSDNNTLIYRERKTVHILFLLPEQEMEKAVGFFDYGGPDKELVKGKYWLNTTSLLL